MFYVAFTPLWRSEQINLLWRSSGNTQQHIIRGECVCRPTILTHLDYYNNMMRYNSNINQCNYQSKNYCIQQCEPNYNFLFDMGHIQLSDTVKKCVNMQTIQMCFPWAIISTHLSNDMKDSIDYSNCLFNYLQLCCYVLASWLLS